ncbi:MAG: hypothetical protein ACXAEU_19105 [Candidatus Hodarchaeales archaeon]|jgi:hypothetical protein
MYPTSEKITINMESVASLETSLKSLFIDLSFEPLDWQDDRVQQQLKFSTMLSFLIIVLFPIWYLVVFAGYIFNLINLDVEVVLAGSILILQVFSFLSKYLFNERHYRILNLTFQEKLYMHYSRSMISINNTAPMMFIMFFGFVASFPIVVVLGITILALSFVALFYNKRQMNKIMIAVNLRTEFLEPDALTIIPYPMRMPLLRSFFQEKRSFTVASTGLLLAIKRKQLDHSIDELLRIYITIYQKPPASAILYSFFRLIGLPLILVFVVIGLFTSSVVNRDPIILLLISVVYVVCYVFFIAIGFSLNREFENIMKKQLVSHVQTLESENKVKAFTRSMEAFIETFQEPSVGAINEILVKFYGYLNMKRHLEILTEITRDA